ncbi:hypothetical protein [Candidatus Nitrosocosmicus hydrocola]|jgi:hypothetical protein|uniref:hypothetical protein n=1 Tax=Candidatus Nitrosocosmicus hydrocola TaxID=1826872 RepID=UPI0011E58A8D|nr:hypothetical protein [Candidatus Nitrosocosmicus hydrocola]
MAFTLLIGNNFISNSPKSIRYNDKILFSLEQDQDTNIPNISTNVYNQSNNQSVKVEKNVLKECGQELIVKKSEAQHILIVDKAGEIIFESRILDTKTILVSGIFYINDAKLTITQNYIILPSEKWIMHDRVNSNSRDVAITNEGITPL